MRLFLLIFCDEDIFMIIFITNFNEAPHSSITLSPPLFIFIIIFKKLNIENSKIEKNPIIYTYNMVGIYATI